MRIRFILAAIAAFAAAPALAGGYGASKDVVDTAVAADGFSTLVTALKEAGLVQTLKGEGPFTVFAPTDKAFEQLPEGTLQSLLKPENRDQLRAVLTYHVVPGKVTAGELTGKTLEAPTVQGQSVSIDATDGVRVEGARVVKADIMASNGVIHVIDRVILPE